MYKAMCNYVLLNRHCPPAAIIYRFTAPRNTIASTHTSHCPSQHGIVHPPDLDLKSGGVLRQDWMLSRERFVRGRRWCGSTRARHWLPNRHKPRIAEVESATLPHNFFVACSAFSGPEIRDGLYDQHPPDASTVCRRLQPGKSTSPPTRR